MGNELLPRFWGWVLTESKTLWGAASQGRAFSQMCVWGLHGCVEGAASSHRPVGTSCSAWLCVSPTAPLAVPVSPRQYSVHGWVEGGREREIARAGAGRVTVHRSG